jgi:hypothetical protein
MQGQSSFSVIAKRLHDLQRKVRELQLWANAQGELLTGTGEICLTTSRAWTWFIIV